MSSCEIFCTLAPLADNGGEGGDGRGRCENEQKRLGSGVDIDHVIETSDKKWLDSLGTGRSGRQPSNAELCD